MCRLNYKLSVLSLLSLFLCAGSSYALRMPTPHYDSPCQKYSKKVSEVAHQSRKAAGAKSYCRALQFAEEALRMATNRPPCCKEDTTDAKKYLDKNVKRLKEEIPKYKERCDKPLPPKKKTIEIKVHK